jgi:hypothetical protein
MLRKTLALVGLGAALALTVGVAGSSALTGTPPYGERVFHNSGLEAFYNAENEGQIGVMLTPKNGTEIKVNHNAVSPIYLPVYPVGSTAESSNADYLCQHLLDDNTTVADNCPDHGFAIAGLAQTCPAQVSSDCTQAIRDVYANGVAGHDHVMDAPGGADFNIAWEPVVVLFTNSTAANEHLVTDTQIEDAVANKDAIEIPLPGSTFHCSVVSNRIWDLGIPVPPASTPPS